jgi:hypothetical protein
MKKSRLDGTDWHFRPDHPPAFGCADCYLQSTCGGLRVKGAALDCQRFCCHKADCQLVCFNSPINYAKRLQEIGGFDLANIQGCDPVRFERIRGYAPLFHHAYSRKEAFVGEVAAVSLYELLTRDGSPKYFSRDDVVRNFRISPDAKLIVSGVHEDRFLERVWASPHRTSIALMLKSIGVAIFTPPNFSVYNNVPRPETLYNIKRIGLISREFLAAGVPTALHVNACTDTDYDRYYAFLLARPEFEAISFDFITGPGYPSRMWWHIRKLIEIKNKLPRQMQLVLRGGTQALNALSGAYSHIVVIDSDPLHRALHRQRMIFGNDGRMRIVKNPLAEGVPVDQLVVQNVAAAKLRFEYSMQNPHIARYLKRRLPPANYADDKSRQLDLLTNSRDFKLRVGSVNTQRVISTSKSKRTAEVEQTTKEIAKATAMPGGSPKS